MARATDDTALQIRQALDEADEVDARRVQIDVEDGRAVLRGAVASHEEAAVAVQVAGEVADTDVVEELQVDPGLREGASEPHGGERVEAAEGEVLVGDADMLAGTETAPEEDVGRVYDENVPWSPPDRPVMPPTAAEQTDRGAGTAGPSGASADTGEPGPAAADLTAEELQRTGRGGTPPSLLPQEDVASQDAVRSVDDLGRAPDDETSEDRMPRRVPGARAGPGAVGESTSEGGSTGSVPATETGAEGADTAEADPARQTGGTAGGTGTDRGPEADEDKAIREDFPERSGEG